MTDRRTRLELLGGRAAVALFVLAMLASFAALLIRRVAVERSTARLDLVRSENQRLETEAHELDLQIGRISTEGQRVATEIKQELGKKQQLQLAMSEVMARASKLRQERDRFTDVRREIQKRLSAMDKHYIDASSFTPAIQPQ